jgi:hypothetical protein
VVTLQSYAKTPPAWKAGGVNAFFNRSATA